jgi:hypothetical protein
MARKHLQNSRVTLTPVTNFTARIVRDLILEGDGESHRDFGMEAELEGRKINFIVSAREFQGMGWVLKCLGPQAIIYPGQQQHARAAIQSLSGSIRQERIFAHLGWTKLGADWVYLQGKSSVALGSQCDVHVQLPAALDHYQLQTPTDSQHMITAVRASLKFLSLGPERITIPLLASVCRAPLGKVDFSVFLTGRSGTFKTALAALCQQHFGAQMDAGRLPANFSSTASALEVLAHAAKDSLLVVDDFVPKGGSSDIGLQGVAERLFRSAGNNQGRIRMGGSGRMSTPRPPRALILASGEEVPHGHSVRARLLIVEVQPGDVDRTILSDCQRAAQEGHFAVSMGAFVAWIASRYEDLQRRLQTRMVEIRSASNKNAVHARLPSAIAELRVGWELFLDFSLEVGAISKEEQLDLAERSDRAFLELELTQIPYHHASDPTLRFLSLLRGALIGGRAHVMDRFGRPPETPEIWGWHLQSNQEWTPQGDCIGWVTGSDVYLEPTTSYYAAQAMAGSERIAVSEQTLRQGLRAGGFLASVDAGRQMLTVRRTLQGCPRQVLHLRATHLHD